MGEESPVSGHLNQSDREDTEEEALDSAAYIPSRRRIRRIPGWAKFPQAPLSFVEGADKDEQVVLTTPPFSRIN